MYDKIHYKKKKKGSSKKKKSLFILNSYSKILTHSKPPLSAWPVYADMMHRMMAKITDPRTRPLGSNLGSVLKCSVQSLSSVWLFATLWTAAHKASLSIPTPGACSNSCPSSWWCHPTILSSAIPFSSCCQSFPASRSFPVSQYFASGGQSTGASASASFLPKNIQNWFPLSMMES